jgi:ferredoxin
MEIEKDLAQLPILEYALYNRVRLFSPKKSEFSIMRTSGSFSSQMVYYNNIALNDHGKASDCIKCGKCEDVCPQQLPVRDYLDDVKEKFEASSIIPTRK